MKPYRSPFSKYDLCPNLAGGKHTSVKEMGYRWPSGFQQNTSQWNLAKKKRELVFVALLSFWTRCPVFCV